MQIQVTPALVALALIAAACTGERAETGPRIVAISEDLRLDADTEDFSSVGRVAANTGGSIAIGLPQDLQIRVYDSTGVMRAAFGRRGQGPGEFSSIGPLAWLGDTLWMFDIRSRRLSTYSAFGTLLSSGPLPGVFSAATPFAARGGIFLSSVSALLTDGGYLAAASMLTPSATGEYAGFDSQVMVRIDSAGEWTTLVTLPDSDDDRWYMSASGFGRPLPFAVLPQLAVSPDGSRFATMTSEATGASEGIWRLTVYNSRGDTLLRRDYPFEGVQIPSSARDSAVAAEAPDRGGATEGPANLDQQFQRIARERMPSIYMPVQSLMLGMDDSIWITLRDSADVRRTLVLDQRGDTVGVVTTSTRIRIRQASRERIWATEIDADGLASVVRYRVTGLECRAVECRR